MKKKPAFFCNSNFARSPHSLLTNKTTSTPERERVRNSREEKEPEREREIFITDFLMDSISEAQILEKP